MVRALAVVIALVAIGGWWWLRDADVVPPLVAAPPASEAAHGAGAVGDVAEAEHATTARAVGAAPVAGPDANPQTAARIAAPPSAAGRDLAVVDTDGRPVVDATVELLGVDVPELVRTDAQGRCRILSEPTERRGGPWVRVAAGDRHCQRSWNGQDRIVLPHVATLHGRLVDALTGAPVADAAIVRRHPHCEGCLPDRTRSDVDGGFTLAGVPRDQECRLVVDLRDCPTQFARVLIPGDQGEVRHTFRIEQGSTVSGRCVDAMDGRPLAGVRIDTSSGAATKTAGDGTFAVAVLTGGLAHVPLTFERRGFCRATFDAPVGATASAATFALPRSGSLAGRVRTVSGQAVAGAVVSARPLPRAKAEPLLADEHDSASTSTNVDGAFVLEGLVPDAAYRVAVAGHFASDEAAPASAEGIAGGARVELVVADAPRTGSIAGSYTCNGEPGAAAIEWTLGARRGEGEVAADGAFRLDAVPAGTVLLRVTPRRHAHTTAAPRVGSLALRDNALRAASGPQLDAVRWQREVEVRPDMELRLGIVHEVADATITGRVRDLDGAPASDDVVASAGGLMFRQATERGAFTLFVPSACGEVLLGCDGGGTVVARPGDRDVELVSAGQRLRLRARAADGRQLQPVVQLRQPGTWTWGLHRDHPRGPTVTVADPDGWRLVWLPHGEQTIVLTADGHAPGCHRVNAIAGASLDVVLQRGTQATVRLHRDAAAPARELRVLLVDECFTALGPRASLDEPPNGRSFALTHAGAAVEGLAPGTHRLVPGDPAMELVPDHVTIGTEPVVVDVQWRPRAK